MRPSDFEKWRDEDEPRDYRRENPRGVDERFDNSDARAFDEALIRARASELEPEVMTDGHVICSGCKREIDPATCSCGDAMEHHPNPMVSGHSAVPMGCDCYRRAQLAVYSGRRYEDDE